MKVWKKYQYSYGHTSTIYKIDDKVIKEIYLPSNDLTKTTKFSELEVTIFMEENFPEYSVSFYVYDILTEKRNILCLSSHLDQRNFWSYD